VSLYVSLYVFYASYTASEAANAVLGNGLWAGKPDDEGLWIGALFEQPVQVITASWDDNVQPNSRIFLEYFSDGGWQFAQVLRDGGLNLEP
jgi:hypothetical protein